MNYLVSTSSFGWIFVQRFKTENKDIALSINVTFNSKIANFHFKFSKKNATNAVIRKVEI